MSKLEELVPPLELCKLIPKGEFEDCCFAWYAELQHINPKPPHEYSYYVANSNKDFLSFGGFNACPAPTLEEIMAELPPYAKNEKILACCVPDWADFNARVFGEHWRVGYTGDVSVNDKSPSTAALKLWLKLKGIEV